MACHGTGRSIGVETVLAKAGSPVKHSRRAAFKEFNEAFGALAALKDQLSGDDMQAFSDFTMQLTYPPNPIRSLDQTLTESQQLGLSLYVNGVQRSNGVLEICVTCHPISEAGGIFGTTGQMAFNNQPGEKDFKIPHFRDQYQKTGMFTSFGAVPRDQVRGFALNHNGATSINSTFSEFGVPIVQTNGLKDFLFAFPAETAPVMGQQLTIGGHNFAARSERLDLLLQRAKITAPYPECDLVAHSLVNGRNRGWAYDRPGSKFRPDHSETAPLDDAEMRELISQSDSPFTMTCLPWGSGGRVGQDRDGDLVSDFDEITQGSNPADAASDSFRARNGLWISPQLPGSGMDLHYADDFLVLNWITYDEQSNPIWYQAVAPAGRNWSSNLLLLEWNPQSGAASNEVVGQVSIEFQDRESGVFNWQVGDKQGQVELERFLFSAEPTELPFSGIWV